METRTFFMDTLQSYTLFLNPCYTIHGIVYKILGEASQTAARDCRIGDFPRRGVRTVPRSSLLRDGKDGQQCAGQLSRTPEIPALLFGEPGRFMGLAFHSHS